MNFPLKYNEVVSWILIALAPFAVVITYPVTCLLWLAYCLQYIWRYFLREQQWVKANGKVVFITGCDSGFGKEAALQLANKGFTVCAGCLRPAECEDLKQYENIRVLDLDVTDEEKIRLCVEAVEKECAGRGLWAVCNNAGFATAGEIEWLPLDVYKKQLETNLWGAVRVTKALLPLIRQAQGRVVNVTTGISRYANPGRSTYCMSKFALEAFTDCLRYEMKKFDVTVITIQPGNFTSSTKVFQGVGVQLRQAFDALSPEVKQAYGQQYLDKFYKQVCENYTKLAGEDIQPVIDTYLHAIASDTPRIRYKPMQMSWIVWLFFHYVLPEELTDLYGCGWKRPQILKEINLEQLRNKVF